MKARAKQRIGRLGNIEASALGEGGCAGKITGVTAARPGEEIAERDRKAVTDGVRRMMMRVVTGEECSKSVGGWLLMMVVMMGAAIQFSGHHRRRGQGSASWTDVSTRLDFSRRERRRRRKRRR